MKFEPIMLTGALALASGAQAQSRVTIPTVQGSVEIVGDERNNQVKGKPGIVVVTPGTPRVSREFASAVNDCISKKEAPAVRTPGDDSFLCTLPGGIGDSEIQYINAQGYQIKTQYIGNPHLTTVLMGKNGISINRGVMSNPTQIQNQMPECQSLMPSNTSISGGGRVVIGSVTTDGYNGSMVYGRKCKN